MALSQLRTKRQISLSREINAEDDLKTTILNLSKPIREVKQECFSTSFQHYRFCSNPDLLRYRDIETELPKSYHRHSQSTKCLRSQLYTKYLLMNLHQMRIIAIFMTKKYIFWLQTAQKIRATLIDLTRNINSQHLQWRDLGKHIPSEATL